MKPPKGGKVLICKTEDCENKTCLLCGYKHHRPSIYSDRDHFQSLYCLKCQKDKKIRKNLKFKDRFFRVDSKNKKEMFCGDCFYSYENYERSKIQKHLKGLSTDDDTDDDEDNEDNEDDYDEDDEIHICCECGNNLYDILNCGVCKNTDSVHDIKYCYDCYSFYTTECIICESERLCESCLQNSYYNCCKCKKTLPICDDCSNYASKKEFKNFQTKNNVKGLYCSECLEKVKKENKEEEKKKKE